MGFWEEISLALNPSFHFLAEWPCYAKWLQSCRLLPQSMVVTSGSSVMGFSNTGMGCMPYAGSSNQALNLDLE